MARIAGVNIPLNKRVEVGLTYVHGIGASAASKIVADTGVDPDTYIKDLTDDETVKLREAVESREVEGDLRRERSQNIKRLSEIGAYRGLRHSRRRSPSTSRDSTASRSFTVSSSVRSLMYVSGSTPVSATILLAAEAPIPWT